MTNLRIPFPRNVNTFTFEATLKEFYLSSTRRTTEHSLFDFTSVEWCEAFQLSQLVLWIAELAAKHKRVSFLLPAANALDDEKRPDLAPGDTRGARRAQLLSYLSECLFLDFLVRRAVLSPNDLDRSQLTRRAKGQESRISPFVFFSGSADFQEFLRSLRRQYELQFAPVFDLEVVRSGEIRDIILKELGENIFDHGNGRFGHILMTLRHPIDSHSSEGVAFLEMRVRAAPGLERSFFLSLRNSGYLTVIVSDKGPGIFNTLNSAYTQDHPSNSPSANPSLEQAVINYALLQHSSSKSPEQRLGPLLELIRHSDLPDYLPATGLFWVKEVVKAYRGLISIRSGRSMVAYDFLTYPEHGHPSGSLLTNRGDQRISRLTAFGGTQIKICLPTSLPLAARQPHFFWKEANKAAISPQYKYIRLVDLPSMLNQEHDHELANWTNSQLQSIRTLRRESRRTTILILDFHYSRLSDAKTLKALFLLVVELMRMQDKSFVVAIVGGEATIARLVDYLAQLPASPTGLPKEKAVLLFDDRLASTICGLSSSETELFSSLAARSIPISDLPDSLLRRIEHLIFVDRLSDLVQPLFSVSAIRNAIRAGIRASLESLILDAKNGIHKPQGCFLLPSGAYSEGYFELHRLFTHPLGRAEVMRWLSYGIDNLQPEFLITLGRGAGSLGAEVSQRFSALHHIAVSDPSPASVAQLVLLPKSSKIVLLADVIGTQRTIDLVLGASVALEVQAILTIVDARETGDAESLTCGGKIYLLQSVLRKPLHYWFKDKPSHYKYEEIIRIDPISNSPIQESFFLEQPLWKQMDEATGGNQFIDEVIRPTNGIVIGHFESGERHIIYLFLFPAVAETFGSDIAETVRRDLERYKGRDPNLDRLAIAVLYPEHTPGAQEIARQLALSLRQPKVIGLGPREIKHPLSFEPATHDLGNVIIFDDASATGFTARQMLEYAERNGGRSIFVYLLCNRADRATRRHLQQIQQYGRATVHVRYLAELPIPTFSPADCPICKRLEALGSLIHEAASFPELAETIAAEMNRLEKQPIQMVLQPDTGTPYLSTPLEDRLRHVDLRAQIELAKTLVPIRNQLANLVRQHERNDRDVLLLFEILADEETYFLTDQVAFREVFYPRFRESIVAAAQRLLRQPETLSEYQAMAVVSVLRIFDPGALLDSLAVWLESMPESSSFLLRITNQLLLSEFLRQRAQLIRDLFRRYAVRTDSPLANKIADFWQRTAGDLPKAASTVSNYKQLYMLLSDSADCANDFAGIEYHKFAHLDVVQVERLVARYWRPLSKLIEGEIVPRVRDLIASDISRSVCPELQRAVIVVSSLRYKADELETIIADEMQPPDVRRTAVSGFTAAMSELQRILIHDDQGTIPRALLELRTDLPRVTRKAISVHETRLRESNIDIVTSFSDDLQLVFGPEDAIFAIVNILLDNIIIHAFSNDSKAIDRTCEIKVSDHGPEVELVITDNGSGTPQQFQYGTGLSTLLTVCSKIACEHRINPPSTERMGWEVVVTFYRMAKD